MNTSPAVSPSDAFAVLPVVDYEPPAQAVSRNVPPCRQSPRAPSLRRGSHPPYRPHPAGRQPAGGPRAAMSAQMRQAAAFADAALRRVLEVIDRRRPVAQLRPLLTPSLVDSVVSMGQSAAGHRGAAVLRRMRLQPAGHRDPEAAAEVSGSYSRGNRIHAIACRVERVPAATGNRWLVVALHIG
ncbi:Rv3235 family protein [Mycobacterium seoulense]|uniref:Rv3235 family protein n=1 Tax=Mycobacterium seoulense TaxID=386911 RepID=UPI003CF7E4E5